VRGTTPVTQPAQLLALGSPSGSSPQAVLEQAVPQGAPTTPRSPSQQAPVLTDTPPGPSDAASASPTRSLPEPQPLEAFCGGTAASAQEMKQRSDALGSLDQPGWSSHALLYGTQREAALWESVVQQHGKTLLPTRTGSLVEALFSMLDDSELVTPFGLESFRTYLALALAVYGPLLSDKDWFEYYLATQELSVRQLITDFTEGSDEHDLVVATVFSLATHCSVTIMHQSEALWEERVLDHQYDAKRVNFLILYDPKTAYFRAAAPLGSLRDDGLTHPVGMPFNVELVEGYDPWCDSDRDQMEPSIWCRELKMYHPAANQFGYSAGYATVARDAMLGQVRSLLFSARATPKSQGALGTSQTTVVPEDVEKLLERIERLEGAGNNLADRVGTLETTSETLDKRTDTLERSEFQLADKDAKTLAEWRRLGGVTGLQDLFKQVGSAAITAIKEAGELWRTTIETSSRQQRDNLDALAAQHVASLTDLISQQQAAQVHPSPRKRAGSTEMEPEQVEMEVDTGFDLAKITPLAGQTDDSRSETSEASGYYCEACDKTLRSAHGFAAHRAAKSCKANQVKKAKLTPAPTSTMSLRSSQPTLSSLFGVGASPVKIEQPKAPTTPTETASAQSTPVKATKATLSGLGSLEQAPPPGPPELGSLEQAPPQGPPALGSMVPAAPTGALPPAAPTTSQQSRNTCEYCGQTWNTSNQKSDHYDWCDKKPGYLGLYWCPVIGCFKGQSTTRTSIVRRGCFKRHFQEVHKVVAPSTQQMIGWRSLQEPAQNDPGWSLRVRNPPA